jgi:energy-coupling factor transporter ATP-binding protein EcfA2
MITNITIKNIKGFGDPPTSLDVEIKSDKINLLIAPNGFGKSSLAVAFDSIKPSKLVVEKDNKYKNNEFLDSSLSLTIDGVTYSADINNNTISPVIEPYVINTGTKVHTFGKSTGAFHSVSGYLDIEDIELSGTIPPSTAVTYQISNITSAAKTKRGVLKSAPFLFSDEFIALSGDVLPLLDKFSAKKRIQIIDDIWTNINSIIRTRVYNL